MPRARKSGKFRFVNSGAVPGISSMAAIPLTNLWANLCVSTIFSHHFLICNRICYRLDVCLSRNPVLFFIAGYMRIQLVNINNVATGKGGCVH